MSRKSLVIRTLYWLRDLRSGALFRALRTYCSGSVLDVGGWDFYETALRKGIGFRAWTILDLTPVAPSRESDRPIRSVVGDGCRLGFRDDSFDTVVSIQVLEHSFEPIRMIEEMCRVLKAGGHLVLLVPATATMHMAPHHYYNFTRYFFEEAMRRSGLRLVELTPLGGAWSTFASRLFYFFFQSVRYPGMSSGDCARSAAFYLLWPFMAAFAAAAIPLCLLFSLGDLTEEPNNHLIVARKEAR